MSTINEPSIEQIIPKPPTELSSFLGFDIRSLNKEEREGYVDAKLDTHEPLISVSNGKHNYIYSFTKAIELIEKEIGYLKSNFYNLLSIFGFMLIATAVVFAIIFFEGAKGSMGLTLASVILPTLSIYLAIPLVQFKHRKKIKELELKKTALFFAGQDYIKAKKEEYKKPVLVV
jgi:hypothetical protein